MPRLGELLVAAGLLTPEQIEQALRAQVLWGGRLGTNLVELHYLELDPLSRALGRQHHLPAALARHFEEADPELQARLPPEIAERFSCLPLVRMGPDQHVVIAAAAPLAPRQLAIIADELAVDAAQLVPAVAAELRIRYQLERVYRIRRAARFLRARGTSIPPLPVFQIPVEPDGEPELTAPSLPVSTCEPAADDDLLPIEVEEPEPVEDEAHARERRRYVSTIADATSDADRPSRLGRIAIRKIAVGSAPRVMAGATLGEATRVIRSSTGRDRVADLVVDALDRFAPACEAAILLVIRGATAIGWKGFQRAGSGLPEIAVPMDDAGMVPRAVELNATLRRASTELDPIDRLLLASLGCGDGDLVVVPIAIADQVMCVIALAADDDASISCAESIAAAASAAFARLMRDASR